MSAPRPPRQRPDIFVVFCIVLTLVALAFVGGRLVVVGSQQEAMLAELRAIRAALEAPPAVPAAAAGAANVPPANLVLNIDGAAVKGAPDAILTMVEFADFECPFCARYVQETHRQIDREYVQTGKVRYVFRHFPLEQIHSRALKAGVAGECARQQDRFWQMHARLFADQSALADAGLAQSAAAVGLGAAAFGRCLDDATTTAKVRRDFEQGVRAGVKATPSFFIGTSAAAGGIQVLRTITGTQPFAVFKETLDALLASQAS